MGSPDLDKATSLVFKIRGMDCAEEVALLKQAVGPLTGQDQLSFNILTGTMSVTGLPADISPQAIVEAVERAGLHAQFVDGGAAAELLPQSFWERRRRTIVTALSGFALLAGVVVQFSLLRSALPLLGGAEQATPLPAIVLFSLATAAGIWLVLPKAWAAARRFRPDMNFLMTVAVAGAIGIGEWFEAAAVSFLFSVSLLLESWSVSRARRAIAALMDLAPPTVRRLLPSGDTEEMSPMGFTVGDIFLVKPGERIPLDGKVIAGESDVNQAPITGESQPLAKATGAEVYAGTINGDGALQVESTKRAADTTLAKIIRMVEEAQSRRGPSEQWVEGFARLYTPIVMFVAALVFLIPTLFFAEEAAEWFYRALVLLVIACPCALVISTPVSVVAALAAAAREGVLIKGGVYVESPAHLKAIAFDKTGTLTSGQPKVVEIVPLSGHNERELIELAAALESHSEHPIARAVLEYTDQTGVKAASVSEFQAIKGRGATATIGGRTFWLGSHRYLEERSQETDEIHNRLEAMSSRGRSVVAIGNEDHVCGLIALADTVRSEAELMMSQLRAEGIKHLVMLTGDNRSTAEAVAKQTGIDEVRAELLPEDKVAAIESLVNAYGQVAMIGDGINDAPAMARASIGIAMGSAGTDAAIETADIALMSDDLSRLPWLIRHSRRTLRVIRQNIAFSLGVKLLFVLLTFFGLASLWSAIAADMGASLLVIFNGLRLLTTRKA